MYCTSFLRGDNAFNWYMLGTRYALVYIHMSLPSISPDGLCIIVFTMRTRPTSAINKVRSKLFNHLTPSSHFPAIDALHSLPALRSLCWAAA